MLIRKEHPDASSSGIRYRANFTKVKEATMVRCAFYLLLDGKLLYQISMEQIKNFLVTGEGLLWVDMEDVKERGRAVEGITRPLLDVQHLRSLR